MRAYLTLGVAAAWPPDEPRENGSAEADEQDTPTYGHGVRQRDEVGGSGTPPHSHGGCTPHPPFLYPFLHVP